jgi:hypothetical protein
MVHAELARAAMRDVSIPSGKATLRGELNVPVDAQGVVLFAHGSGSSCRTICEAGSGTLLHASL